MGLTKNKNSLIFYIRMYWNKQLIKFSLRTRNPELANQMYQAFLFNLMKDKVFNNMSNNKEIKMIDLKERPVVNLKEKSMVNLKEKSNDSGFNEFINKNYMFKELLEATNLEDYYQRLRKYDYFKNKGMALLTRNILGQAPGAKPRKPKESKYNDKELYEILKQGTKEILHKFYGIVSFKNKLTSEEISELMTFKDEILNKYRELTNNNPVVMRELEKEINKHIEALGSFHHEKAKNMIPIKKVYDEYIETSRVKGYTNGTIQTKIRIYEDLKKNNIITFSDINQANINKMVIYWQSKKNKQGNGNSSSTLDTNVDKLKSFLNYAKKHDYISEKELNKLTFPPKSNKINETVIKDKDYDTIINSIDDEDFKMYIHTLYNTGARAGEILNLKTSDIDYENHALRKYQSKTNYYSWVVMDSVSFKILINYINEHNIDDDSYIFIGINQGKEYYGKKFKKLIKRLGLNPKYNLTRFRHTYATNLLNKTGDIKLVQEQLGHKSIVITAKHYANRTLNDRKEIIDEAFEKK